MKRPLIIAFGGGSGSGKTTLANELSKTLSDLKVSILTQDHYYKDLSHLSPEERHKVNFDRPEALDLNRLHSDLKDLSQGKAISHPEYCFETHTRRKELVPFSSGHAVIFDGIFSLCFEELLPLYTLKVFVDVPSDIRLLRRIARDQVERGRSFESIRAQYIETVRPGYHKFIRNSRSKADLIIPWERRSDPAVQVLGSYIRSNAC